MKTVSLVYEDHATGRRVVVNLSKAHVLSFYANLGKQEVGVLRGVETILSEMNPHTKPKEPT